MKSRFAPSPTGYLHIGGARTALFAWIWAKKQQGKFVLRIEDTDQERSTQKSINAILDGMNWLGLYHDEGPFYQTKRFDRYKQIIQRLLDTNKAYYCECSKQRLQYLREALIKQSKKAKYDGCCRHKNLNTGVVRFQNPKTGLVIFNDIVKGKISISNDELNDLIIARNDGTPTYNLTVVVDDHDMEISTVIRGDDHINNTPRQINLYHSLNWELPKFAHLPMILGSDGSRLSKRHGAVNVMTYKDEGFLPEALLNYLSRLGWSHKDQEIFSIEEIIKLFELKNINKSAASFNQDKLLWLNQEHIKRSTISNLIHNLKWYLNNQSIDTSSGPDIKQVVESLQQRCKTLVDMANSMRMFYQDFDMFNESLANKHFNKNNINIISALITKLNAVNNWSKESIHQVIQTICDEFEVNFAKVGQPLRLALSGDGNAGSVDVAAKLVGKKRTLHRLNRALDYIHKDTKASN